MLRNKLCENRRHSPEHGRSNDVVSVIHRFLVVEPESTHWLNRQLQFDAPGQFVFKKKEPPPGGPPPIGDPKPNDPKPDDPPPIRDPRLPPEAVTSESNAMRTVCSNISDAIFVGRQIVLESING
jgi:hypothetical protein